VAVESVNTFIVDVKTAQQRGDVRNVLHLKLIPSDEVVSQAAYGSCEHGRIVRVEEGGAEVAPLLHVHLLKQLAWPVEDLVVDVACKSERCLERVGVRGEHEPRVACVHNHGREGVKKQGTGRGEQLARGAAFVDHVGAAVPDGTGGVRVHSDLGVRPAGLTELGHGDGTVRIYNQPRECAGCRRRFSVQVGGGWLKREACSDDRVGLDLFDCAHCERNALKQDINA